MTKITQHIRYRQVLEPRVPGSSRFDFSGLCLDRERSKVIPSKKSLSVGRHMKEGRRPFPGTSTKHRQCDSQTDADLSSLLLSTQLITVITCLQRTRQLAKHFSAHEPVPLTTAL